MNVEKKIDRVKEILKDREIAIAFSGGADSTLMAHLASIACKRVLAITIDNNIFPPGFVENTKKICKSLNISQEIVFEDFYTHEDIISNRPDRCFLCREEMYRHIARVARENGFSTIADGTNISDLVQDRPGILIIYENNIESPFVEARLTSAEIHGYLDKKGIPYSKSTTCLATRVPFNVEFDREKYGRISRSEAFIYENTDCEIVKVREKYPDCVVEVDNLRELKRANRKNRITDQLNANGYEEIILNLEEIRDNEEIILTYGNGRFLYELPFEIDLERTIIEKKNISVTEDGVVLGKGYNSYEEALADFMDTLPKIWPRMPDF